MEILNIKEASKKENKMEKVNLKNEEFYLILVVD